MSPDERIDSPEPSGERSRFTFRDLRLLSQYSTGSSLRVIALIDFDCFYAQCERVRLGLPEGRPLGVQQFKHVIATNYEARAAGLKKVVTAVEARRLCPDIVLQHVPTWREGDHTWRYREDAVDHMSEDKSSLDYYRLQSRRAIELVKAALPPEPLQKVEKASIDEIFLDLSAHVHNVLLERFSELLAVETRDLDTALPKPWTELLDWKDDRLVETGTNEGIDQAPDWDDVALNIGAEIVRDLRQRIVAKLHYTCSGGVARNKVVAKLAAGHNKPNRQTIVRNTAIEAFLSGYKYTKLRGLGGKLGSKAVQVFSSEQLSDLLQVPLKQLQRELGVESGAWVYHVIRGRDSSEVTPRTQIKSMLSAKTFDPGIRSLEQAEKWLQIFAADIIGRLEEQEGRRPKTLAVHHHVNGRFGPTRSKQVQIPLGSKLDVSSLAGFAREVLEDLVRDGEPWPCWSLSIGVSDFIDTERTSHSIASMFAAQHSPGLTPRPTQSKTQELVVQYDRFKSTQKLKKRTITDFQGFSGADAGAGSHAFHVDDSKRQRQNEGHQDRLDNPTFVEAEKSSYECPKCSSFVHVEAVLEHLDWHVALDLQNAE